MSAADRLLYAENMKVLDAEQRLRDGCADNEVYDLVLLATGSERLASEAFTRRIEAVHKAGGTANV